MYMYIYKILKPPFPVLKAGHHCYSIFIWTYNLMSVCVCMRFSKPLRMPVGVCVYIRLCASLYSLYMYIYVHVQHTASFSFIKTVSSFTISLMLVCYTHIFHVRTHTCVHVHVQYAHVGVHNMTH